MSKFLYLLILSSLLFGDFNTTILDIYHDKLSQILVESSNSVDDYFIETHSIKKSKTQAELKTSFAVESNRESEYALRFRLRINLPKIQKKFRLFFEDEDSDNIFYDGTKLDNRYRVNNKSYFLRLDFFDYIFKKIDFTSGFGVKFRKFNLYPYVNLKVKYLFENRDFIANSRFRLYSDGKFENAVTLSKIEHLKKNIYILYRNFFKYKDRTNSTTIINSISMTKIISHKQELTTGVSFASRLDALKAYLSYQQLYIAYREIFYKNWLYYEVSPSILWREENNFDSSYRCMFNLGMKFSTN